MRIVVHDYVGHPFQIELSKELARRGFEVFHLYFGNFPGPKGALEKESAGLNLHVESIEISKPFKKYSFIRRRFQEVEYGRRLARRIQQIDPDVVLSTNTPIEAQNEVVKVCRRLACRFIFWVQDVYSIATYRLLKTRLPGIGHVVGQIYMRIERNLLRQSDAIILITEDFHSILAEWQVPSDNVSVIPNWATLDNIPVLPRNNEWARQHQLTDKLCFLYSGTLGLKHNPELFVELSRKFQAQSFIKIVVISEGLGADWLKEQQNALSLDNLLLLPFQPYDQLPQVLATGDVLMAILEPDAGIFSVPSKVLTYLCARRPLLLAVPPENLAARIVQDNRAGLVVPPMDITAFLHAAETLAQNPSICNSLGYNARHYAETQFDIRTIGDKFEEIICSSPQHAGLTLSISANH